MSNQKQNVMEIKITKESLSAFNGGKKLIPAPIDDKNLMEDSFEDEVFADFHECADHHESGKRHLMGRLDVLEESNDNLEIYIDAYIDVAWQFGGNTVCITLLACPVSDCFDTMSEDLATYYTREFKKWECPDNEYLVVQTRHENNKVYISFFFEC